MKIFESYLNKFTEPDWLAAVDELLPSIHEVDRNAVQIWFRFYPLSLKRFVDAAENRDDTLRGLAMNGSFDLSEQIDTSHHFLYGHRYWKAVKCAIKAEAEDSLAEPEELVELIKNIGMHTAEKVQSDRSLTNAIAAIGLMTLNQVGADAFFKNMERTTEPTGLMAKSPERIVAERAKDDSQGLFGFLKTVDKKFSVNYSALTHDGTFPIIADEEIVTASQKDRSQDWQAADNRCWEGPVPIECTSASCGTCWVGVIGGEEKLTEVGRRERRAMKVFGYNQPDDERPYLRLACQTRATGNLTLVIPPWNGVFGKKVYGNVEEIELEPNTTSAKHLREIVKEATAGVENA
jgi:ferredoxin